MTNVRKWRYYLGTQYILDQLKVEKVQRRATKLISDLQNCTYDDQLAELNLSSLKYCRQCGDVIIAYQLLHNNLNIETSDMFIMNNLLTTRGHNYKLFKLHDSTTRVRLSFFTMRVIGSDWNNLPYYACSKTKICLTLADLP